MPVIYRNTLNKINNSYSSTVPKRFADTVKNEVGVIVFDLSNKRDRLLFFKCQEIIMEEIDDEPRE